MEQETLSCSRKIITWNTGRFYCNAGQRISAIELPSGKVAFFDFDRQVFGVTKDVFDIKTYPGDLISFVMNQYDTRLYNTCGIHDAAGDKYRDFKACMRDAAVDQSDTFVWNWTV